MELFFESAKAFASERHQGQTRRDGRTPSITHPVRVAERLHQAGVTRAEILAAAVLHDVIEDTTTQPDELIARFGPRVVSLVEEVSRLPGMTRKDFLARVATSSARSVLLRVADRLDNLEEMNGVESDLRTIYAEEGLRLAATALTNPRLDNLFAAERRALDELLSQLIDTAITELARAPKPRRGRTHEIVASLPPRFR